MTNDCQNYAILGYDTKNDCFDANKGSELGETTSNMSSLATKILDIGDILAIIFGTFFVFSTTGMIYCFGKRLLRAVNRFLAACQRAANTFSTLRDPLRNFVFREYKKDAGKTSEKSPEKEKTPKVERVEVTTEKQKKKKAKKVKISTPKPKTLQVTAQIEHISNQVSLHLLVLQTFIFTNFNFFV